MVLGFATMVVLGASVQAQTERSSYMTVLPQPTPIDDAYPGPSTDLEPPEDRDPGPYPGPVITPPTISPTQSPIAISLEAQKALSFVAQREGLAVEDLLVVNESLWTAPLLGRTFQAVTLVTERRSGMFFRVLVDHSTGRVEDSAAIIEAEQRAHLAKYDKLQPNLFERLQQMRAEDVAKVTVWVTAGPGQSLGELEASVRTTLAEKYPQVREAVARGSSPTDVDDPVLAEELHKEYARLIDQGMEQRVQPLVDALKVQGVTAQTSPGLPAVTVDLTKDTILSLTERSDVSTIYLAEGGQRVDSLSFATASVRARTVWRRGYDGNGIDLAILENGNVDFTSNTTACPASTNNCFQYPGAVRAGGDPQEIHATLVASVAASNNPQYKGIAPGARVISAGIPSGDNRQDDIDALAWALNPPQGGAEVVNASYNWCDIQSRSTTQLDVIDKAFDHYARARRKLIVVTSGNYALGCTLNYNVMPPGRAWNVLTVGSYDDRGTADWSDDFMSDTSRWGNPASDHREKPEVVAPGVDITGIGANGVSVTNSGTSFAAPQVAGLAALLMDRTASLISYPEALRAIIMSSADHNLEGPTGMISGADHRDGAGGISADFADTTAATRCSYGGAYSSIPCWWGEYINTSSFDTNNHRNYYFNGQEGDRVRVAISWMSTADCPSAQSCAYDRLGTNLDLTLMAPDGTIIGISASSDNNYELVPFDGYTILPVTGLYRIRVTKSPTPGVTPDANNYLGVAWTRLNTAVPTENINTAFFDSDGGYTVFKGMWYWFRPTPTSNWLTDTIASLVYASPNAATADVATENIDAAYVGNKDGTFSGFTVIKDNRYWYRAGPYLALDWSTNTLASAYNSSASPPGYPVPTFAIAAAYFDINGAYTVIPYTTTQGNRYWYRTSPTAAWYSNTLASAYNSTASPPGYPVPTFAIDDAYLGTSGGMATGYTVVDGNRYWYRTTPNLHNWGTDTLANGYD